MKIIYTPSFRKDWKKVKKQKKNLSKLTDVINLLKQNKTLPESYRDHKLVGNWTGYRECHIESDWLLVYKWKEENLVLTLILKRTGFSF